MAILSQKIHQMDLFKLHLSEGLKKHRFLKIFQQLIFFCQLWLKSNSMITSHGLNRDWNKTQEWYRANGFSGGVTTIRPNRARKVHHNRFEGDLARCSIYDESYNKIVSDESVVNGGTYELLYIQGRYILEDAHRLIQPSLNDLWKEINGSDTTKILYISINLI